MKTYRERPYVVCHMLSSIDGKISGPHYAAPEMGPVREESLKIRESYHCDAVLNGTVTCAEIYADGYIGNLPAPDAPCPRTDYIAGTDVKQYVVCIDTEGSLKWNGNTVERRGRPRSHVIEVLTETVPDSYLAYLRGLEISYIFAGKDALDAPLALQKLKKLFHINSMLICGGGVINWSFLQAGLIDELSIVICPLTDGMTDTASTFDRSDFLTENNTVAFTLEAVRKLPGNGVWLNYKPNNSISEE